MRPGLLLLVGVAGCGAADAGGVVSGVVSAGGRALASARVRIQTAADRPGVPAYVPSDGAGRFRLPVPPDADALVVTAGADGWKNAGAPARAGDELALELRPIPDALPPGAATAYRFKSGATGDFPCFQCHGALVAEWQGSSHAAASLDPLVLDRMGAYLAFLDGGRDLGRRFIEGGREYTVVADRGDAAECARCHAPALALRGDADFRFAAASIQGERAVREGVTCDVCHKMRGVRSRDLTLPGIDLADLRFPSPGDEVIFGPYDDTIFAPTQAAYAPALSTGEACAPCHTNARVVTLELASGERVERRIYGEDTYREWAYPPEGVRAVDTDGDPAPAGQGPYPSGGNYAGRPLACQDCHMASPPPDPSTGEAISGWLAPTGERDRVATHAEAPLRDPSEIHPHGFEGVTPRMVTWAVELRVAARRDGGEVAVDVELENRHTGHCFPSGLPDRNALLVVEATGAAGPLAQTAGPRLPSWAGPAAGLAGRGYARRLADADGNEGAFYAFAVRDGAPDTRLCAGAIDRLSLRFASPTGPDEPVEIVARVVHRRLFPDPGNGAIQETPGDRLVVRIP